jgi:diadenosine tetraphosphatase ApaH/serine/threonine PP2A family protein phosphatase
MKLAIISDIHGNYDALRQVLADIDRCSVDQIVSLGDNIGYGPESDRVVQKLIALDIRSVLGNHELAIKNPKYLNWFNPVARKSLLKTRDLLSESSILFVKSLEPYLSFDGCRCVHGFPPDSPLIYMFQPSEKRTIKVFEELQERICFIGHTHTLEMMSFDGEAIETSDLPQGLTRLAKGKKYIINIGSVGQPRDDSSDAKYIIWDTTQDTIEVKFVPYEVAAVVQKIKAAGLPEEHADRLW